MQRAVRAMLMHISGGVLWPTIEALLNAHGRSDPVTGTTQSTGSLLFHSDRRWPQYFD